MRRTVSPSSWLALGGLLALSLISPAAWALYKVVGPDGRVTYSDRAPTDKPVQPIKANGGVIPTDNLPYELKRVVDKYPVTLYTGQNCTPCDSGRALLQTRGVPFTEKTVSTSDDVKTLQKLEGTDQLPVVRIGQKQLQGYSQSEWTAFLDAANYPVRSALPASYRAPAATPLTTPSADKAGGATPGSSSSPRAPANAAPNEPPVKAPPGIRF